MKHHLGQLKEIRRLREDCERLDAALEEAGARVGELLEENATANTEKQTAKMEVERYKKKLMARNKKYEQARELLKLCYAKWNQYPRDSSILKKIRALLDGEDNARD